MVDGRWSMRKPGPAFIAIVLYALLFLAALVWLSRR
jgi:hypothetical protein